MQCPLWLFSVVHFVRSWYVTQLLLLLLSLVTPVIILLFSANITPDEAHLMCNLNDAYLEGFGISLSVAGVSAVATFECFIPC
jgi:hypothetical protein